MVTDKKAFNTSTTVFIIVSFLVLSATFFTLHKSVSAQRSSGVDGGVSDPNMPDTTGGDTGSQPVVSGSSWYSDGATSKSGPAGTQVTVYATGAYPNIPYKLMTGRNQCSTDLVAVNPNNRFAGTSGLIGNTSGVINREPGTYDLCFADTSSAVPSTTTSILTFTVTSTLQPTVPPVVPTSVPTTVACIKSNGDANCDNLVNLSDFEQWRREFTGELSSKLADFNNDGSVSIIDFEIWRRGFFAASNPVPTSTPFDMSRCTIVASAGRQITNGTEGDDVICVVSIQNVVYGAGGNDTIYINSTDNYIEAGAGADTILEGPQGTRGALYAQDGNDTIDTVGGLGSNVVDGGAGTDTCRAKVGDVVSNCEQ